MTGMGITASIASGTLGMPFDQHMTVMSSKPSLPESFAASAYVSVTIMMILTCATLTIQKRGDIAVILTPASPNVYDPVSRLYHNDIIIDVKLVSMVSGLDTVLNPPALIQNEASKVTKHGPFYAPLGFSFLPSAASCFGGLGPAAIRFLYALADYELAQHDDWLAQQGLEIGRAHV